MEKPYSFSFMLVCSLCSLWHHLEMRWDAPIPLLATSALKIWHLGWKTSEIKIKERMCQEDQLVDGRVVPGQMAMLWKVSFVALWSQLGKARFLKHPIKSFNWNHPESFPLPAEHMGGGQHKQRSRTHVYPSLNRNAVCVRERSRYVPFICHALEVFRDEESNWSFKI